MTQDDAPHGTLALLRHPGNKIYIAKTSFGRWRNVETGYYVDPEDFRAGWFVLYLPPDDS